MVSFFASLPNAFALGLIWSIMALGVYITYKILNVADLTVDGSFVTGGIVAAVLITGGMNFFLALLIATIAGAICGLLTGLLHTLLGIPAILAGILTQMALWSINLLISGSRSNISVASFSYSVLFAQSDVWDALWKIALIFGVFVTLLYIFFGTELGASIRATGNNQDMARAQGINTKLNIVLGLMISNALVALSGALLAQYQGFADINMGKGAIVIGLCAVVIGTAIMGKISQNFLVRLLGCAVGGLIYYIIFQIVVFLGLDTNLLKMLAAVIVIVFLGVPYIQRTYGMKLKKHLDNKKIVKGENVK